MIYPFPIKYLTFLLLWSSRGEFGLCFEPWESHPTPTGFGPCPRVRPGSWHSHFPAKPIHHKIDLKKWGISICHFDRYFSTLFEVQSNLFTTTTLALGPKIVAVVDRRSLFRDHLRPQNVGRCWQVVATRRWSLTQVWQWKYEFKNWVLCISIIQNINLIFETTL